MTDYPIADERNLICLVCDRAERGHHATKYCPECDKPTVVEVGGPVHALVAKLVEEKAELVGRLEWFRTRLAACGVHEQPDGSLRRTV